MKIYSISIIFLLFFSIFSCSGNFQNGNSKKTSTDQNPGKLVYTQYCVTCHGSDGQLGLNGAANLASSKLNKEERITVITNGRNLMAPYRKILTQKQIGDVTDYILTFNR